MDLCIYRLLIDFGLLFLIWIVQLIIYPSFTNFSKEDLTEWHKKYTVTIGVLVGPLMLAQLAVYLIQAFFTPTFLNIGTLILVITTWLVTFFQFVPMHKAISLGEINDELLEGIVKKNWSRTIIWSLLFIISSFSCM
ncbi:MAG: hypothetical protein AAGC43_09585 [Bacteroidota bacterium]